MVLSTQSELYSTLLCSVMFCSVLLFKYILDFVYFIFILFSRCDIYFFFIYLIEMTHIHTLSLFTILYYRILSYISCDLQNHANTELTKKNIFLYFLFVMLILNFFEHSEDYYFTFTFIIFNPFIFIFLAIRHNNNSTHYILLTPY